jgi:hypothetical protein
MRRYLWFSLMASVFFAGATGQTQDGVSARREKVVEENLHYLAVIKGPPRSLSGIEFLPFRINDLRIL